MTTHWGINHYESCTRPPDGEDISVMDIGDNVEVLQCVHCGAYRTRDIPTGPLPALPPLTPAPSATEWAREHRVLGTGRLVFDNPLRRPPLDFETYSRASLFTATAAHEMSREEAEEIRERFREVFGLPTLADLADRGELDILDIDFSEIEKRVLSRIDPTEVDWLRDPYEALGRMLPDKVESMKPPPDYLQHDPTKNTKRRRRK